MTELSHLYGFDPDFCSLSDIPASDAYSKNAFPRKEMKRPDQIPGIQGAANILHYAGTYIPASHSLKSHTVDIHIFQESLQCPHTSDTLCPHPEDQDSVLQMEFPLR